MMAETAGDYCISVIEIQYGFHATLSSNRHTKRAAKKLWRAHASGNSPSLPNLLTLCSQKFAERFPDRRRNSRRRAPAAVSQKLAALTRFWISAGQLKRQFHHPFVDLLRPTRQKTEFAINMLQTAAGESM